MANKAGIKLKKLKAEFSKYLTDRLDHIPQEWQALCEHFDKASLLDFHREIHSLYGSSTTYGFSSLGQKIRDLEIYLQQLLPYATINPTQQSEISRLIERIKDTMQEEQIPALEEFSVRAISNNLIIFLVKTEGKFEQELQKNLSEVGCTLTCLTNFNKLQTILKTQIPAAIIIDESHLEDNNIIALEKINRQLHINFLCLIDHDDIQTRLKSIHAGASIFLLKPVDLYHLTNRLVHLCGVSTTTDYRILIVEDSESLANYYGLVLEEAGMSARTITNPMELIKELQEFRPNLLLMDLYLPGCTGFELAMMVRMEERYSNMPIIFVSTENDRYKQLAILNSCGGDDFLTKPVLPQSLVAAVKTRAQRSAALVSYIAQDGLTNLLNHTNILTQLDLQIIKTERDPQILTFAMIDLDNFKLVNDQYGHPIGDLVLKKIAGFLSGMVRHTDLIGRYGGEEFAVILPKTNLESAIRLCNRIREKFATTTFEAHGNTFNLTLSIGIADYPTYQTIDSLVAAADRALYQAKSNGRNRVEAQSSIK